MSNVLHCVDIKVCCVCNLFIMTKAYDIVIVKCNVFNECYAEDIVEMYLSSQLKALFNAIVSSVCLLEMYLL